MTAPPQTVYLVRSNRPCSGASPSALGRRLRFGYCSSETRGGRLFGFLGNFRELRHSELRRIPLPRTTVNGASPEMRQTSSAGNISSATTRPKASGLVRRRKSVSTEEENKATFRRYIEEVWNRTNLELVDEIFDRYLSHQPDGPTLERGPQDVKRFVSEFRSAFPDFRISIDDQ